MTSEPELTQPSAPQTASPVPDQPSAPRGLAPWWHTAVLVLAILALSYRGSTRIAGYAQSPRHLWMYGSTIVVQLVMLGWVALGLWLGKTPFRTLFGRVGKGAKALFIDIGIAMVFWIFSMTALGTINIVWFSVDAAVHHRPLISSDGHSVLNDPERRADAQRIAALAPSNGMEVGGWILLCTVVGFVEETVFRGYLQRQFTAWGRGKAAWGVVFSALVFGAAHGYEGLHTMVLLAVYGALFGLLALLRGSLRSCMIAHGWHDLFSGLMLALLRSQHLL